MTNRVTMSMQAERTSGRAWKTLGLVAALSLAACAGEVDQDPSLESQGFDLQNIEDGPEREFVRGLALEPTDGPDIFPTLDPTVCTNRFARAMVVSRDAQQRYRGLFAFGGLGLNHSDWANFSSPSGRTFNTRPACAMREDGPSGEPQFVLVGKATDNRFYVSTGDFPNPDFSLPPPVLDQDWIALNTRTYGTGAAEPGPAEPALASKDGTINGGMVLAFISGSTVYAHYHALPYAGNVWQQRVAAPPLPGGAVPEGAPAITFLDGFAQVFHVVVRATVNGQSRFYETYFGRTQNGFAFCGILCFSQAPTWNQLPITGTISSSPALDFSPLHGETLYFRRNGDLMQTSGYATSQQLGTLPIRRVHPGLGETFAGSPRAVSGQVFEMGSHLVVSRTSGNEIVLLESQPDAHLIP